MSKTAIVLVLGVIGTLWGLYALFLAFNNYTPDTSFLGRGVPDLEISYSYNDQGVRSPSPADEQVLFAADLAKRDAAVETHKVRGGIVLGVGVLLLTIGILVSKAKRAQRKK